MFVLHNKLRTVLLYIAELRTQLLRHDATIQDGNDCQICWIGSF